MCKIFNSVCYHLFSSLPLQGSKPLNSFNEIVKIVLDKQKPIFGGGSCFFVCFGDEIFTVMFGKSQQCVELSAWSKVIDSYPHC